MPDETRDKQTRPLSKKKREILEELEIAIEADKKWDGLSVDDFANMTRAEKEEFDKCRQHYNNIRDQAIKAGLHTHPLVGNDVLIVLWDYILLHKKHGNWEHLRALKRGLEKGVREPHSYQKLKEKYELFEEYCRLREKGLSDEAIRRKLIPSMTRQALLKRLADLIESESIKRGSPLDELDQKIMKDLVAECGDEERRNRRPRTLGEIRDRTRRKRKFSPDLIDMVTEPKKGRKKEVGLRSQKKNVAPPITRQPTKEELNIMQELWKELYARGREKEYRKAVAELLNKRTFYP